MDNLDNNQTASAMPSTGMNPDNTTAPTQVPQAPLNAGSPAPISSGGPQPGQQTSAPDPYAMFNPKPANSNGRDKDDPYAMFNPQPASNDNSDKPGVMSKIGSAAWEATKDAAMVIPNQLADWGAMDRGMITPTREEDATHINPETGERENNSWLNPPTKQAHLSDVPSLALAFIPGAPEEAGVISTRGKLLLQGKTAPDILPMSGGEATQNAGLQRFERNSAADLNGNEATKSATDFRASRNDAMSTQINALGKVKDGNSPTTALANIQQIIKDNFDKSAKNVDDLYDHARDVNKDNPVTVPKDDLQENLLPQLKEIADDHLLNSGVSPDAKRVLDDLTRHFNPAEADGEIPAIDDPLQKEAQEFLASKNGKSPEELNPPDPKLEDLIAWRRKAGNVGNTTSDDGAKTAIGKMKRAYDDYMNGLQAGVGSEDFEGIQSYKDANAARAEHGKAFEGNNLVEGLTSLGEKGNKSSIDDLSNKLFGAGSISGKNGILDNYQALMRAAGDKAAEVQANLQQGFAQKVFNGSVDKASSKMPGGVDTAVSPKMMQTQFENLFVNQREFARALYGDAAVANADKIIAQLKQINSKQPYVANNSGSAVTGAQMIKQASDVSKTISHMPGAFGHIIWKLRIGAYAVSKVLGAGEEVAADKLAAQQAKQTFSGAVPPEFDVWPKVKPQPKQMNPKWLAAPALNNDEGDTDNAPP